ncbi:hypothetical protein LTR36_004680 [Oleoguttula mirabilis]|uniref:Glycosyltransferase family 28 N-terminal domain-containing protein n=1 Tax=Oleoguttula mirabilis TaxID=1507867 RepID=A0AAV9JGG7_9PEZI|nr:hypothetical protein LTR36_004680 [Oleoguttula mirabilis]
MAPPKRPNGPAELQDNAAATLMVQQAEAAALNKNDTASTTAAERKHMGHDVPTTEESSADAKHFEDDVPPPAYGEHYGAIHNEQDGFGTNASVGEDGRVNIRIKQSNKKLSSLLVPALRHQQAVTETEHAPPPAYIPPSLGGDETLPSPPPMNVVIQVVGSRGDVQPFVALGKVLKDTYKHRVRLATHPVFRDFVTENGLEFFSIGGDPAQLMAFMVKNPGLMPGFDTLRSGDVGKRRKEVGEYIKGCWRSCYEAGDGRGPEATDETIEDWAAHNPATGDDSNKPFVADCIIANPPSFAHIHCAEKLGIPLHIMFTMPYSPTQAFPHPLANIQSSNADPHLTNYMSYALIDMLTWQGLGDVINRFRQKSLGLEPISLVWAPGMLQRLKIPHTYCWSPALIPKPKDWGQHISISGFYFLNLASNYTPAPNLQAFLNAGPPPVYIGFGSIVLDDPNGMTKLIFEAVERTGQRALVSKGWGGVGADELGIPESVFMLGNVPHDWLFKHVSCVVHHGGAGTTAAGITAGRPTLVVPFFGDQQFWGAMVARAGAGPEPIPHKQLTAEKLAEGIETCLRPESLERAHELADKIASERGSDVGAQCFHQMLDVDKLRCNLTPTRAAAWRLKRTQVRLSAMAACTLANEGLLDFNELKLFRPREYETDDGPWDPITGGATAIVGTMTSMMMGVADFPTETLKALHIHPDSVKKKKTLAEGDAISSPESESVGQVSEDKSSYQPGRSLSTTDTAVSSGASTPATSRSNSTFNLQESLARIQTPTSPLSKDRGLSPTGHGSIPQSMADALKGQLQGTRPRSQSGSRPRSQSGAGSAENMMETAMDTGKGVRKIIGAGFSSPMDFTMGLAKGFHNAPKLYGDDTVRKSEQVTDFRSGIRAATKEFGYGMYDGITGLVTQPMRGAAKEGPAGFFKGIGKGIGGIALKPGAAIFGIPGYAMKGVYKEMQKQFGSSVQNYIIAARTAQGFDDWQSSSVEERTDVVRRWKELQKDLKKKRNPDEMVRDILEEQRKKKLELMERWKAEGMGGIGAVGKRMSRGRAASTSQFNRSAGSPGFHDAQSATLATEGSQEGGLEHARTFAGPEGDDDDLLEAIKLSVQETSRGDPEEDAAIERAIQASMAELQKDRSERGGRRGGDDEDEHMRQALMASQAEADGHGHPDATHDKELERVLAQSLKEQRRQRSGDGEWDSEPETGDDRGHVAGTTKAEFERQQTQQVGGEKAQREKTEEEVVMEYIKKQSLLEQEHQQKSAGKRKAPQEDHGPVDDSEDEELQRAMTISMQDNSGS